MAINPFTGKEDETIEGLTAVGTGPSPVFENVSGETTTGFSNIEEPVEQEGFTDKQKETIAQSIREQGIDAIKGKVEDSGKKNAFIKKLEASVATKDNAIVDKDITIDESTGEESVITGTEDVTGTQDGTDGKRYVTQESADAARIAREIEAAGGPEAYAANKARAEAEKDSKKIQEQADQQISDFQKLFDEELARETERIKAAGQRTMDSQQRLNSLRGGGRSSANEGDIMKIQGEVNTLISAAQRQSDLKMQMQRMKIEGAEAEAIAAIGEKLAQNSAILAEAQAKALETNNQLNGKLGATFQEAMDSQLGILEAAGEDIAGIDQAKSAKLGYFVNADGSVYLNNAKNPVQFKQTVGSGDFTAKQIDNFAQGISGGYAKFSDYDLQPEDVAAVLGAMNAKLDNKSGGAIVSLKAQRILKDLGLGVDEESTRTVANLLKVNSEQEVRDMIATDEFKSGAFVAGNQKLFDDLRKDSESYKGIKNTYQSMQDIWSDFQNNPSESRAAMEQALIIMFNKMLDPGSVVREGEFDRTSQGQSAINAAEGWLQKLVAGGAGIKNEAFEDIVNISKVLQGAAQGNVDDLKESYGSFAGDLGADPEFVNRFFDIGFDAPTGFSTSENQEFESLNQGYTTGGTGDGGFQSSEGFEINFEGSDFNNGDQTSSSKDLVSFIKAKEGFRDTAYQDSKGVWTIGYGATKINGKPVQPGMKITQEQGEQLLQTDIDRHSNYQNAVTVPLTNAQKTALASFEFNLGPNIWKTTGKDIIDAINRGDLNTAAEIMKKHNRAGNKVLSGLTKRRNQEAQLLIS